MVNDITAALSMLMIISFKYWIGCGLLLRILENMGNSEEEERGYVTPR